MTYPLNPEVVITTHYAMDDTEFMSDYCSITIEIDGVLVQEYGDASHDRGMERAGRWEDAVRRFFPHWQITYKNVADIEI
jgi:hypothetical protein